VQDFGCGVCGVGLLNAVYKRLKAGSGVCVCIDAGVRGLVFVGVEVGVGVCCVVGVYYYLHA